MSRTSVDAFNIYAATGSAPAIIRGSADAATYPGVTLGALPGSTERTANGTALNAFLAYCNTNGKYAEFSQGRYEYIAEATQNSRNTGLHALKDVPGLVGAGSDADGTQLAQYATNYPALTIGDITNTASNLTEGAKYGGFQVGHGASQSGQTSGDALLLGRIWRSSFDDIFITPFLVGTTHSYRGLTIGASSNQFFFSNKIGTITIKSGLQNLLYTVSNMTGNRWDNVYCGTGTFGSRLALAAEPVFFNSSGTDFGTFGQLNIEWVNAAVTGGGAIRIDNNIGGFIEHVHFEGVQVNGFNGAIFHIVASNVNIGSCMLLDCWIAAANASGTPAIIQLYGDSKVKFDQMHVKWNGSGYNAEAVASMAFSMINTSDTTVGRNPRVEIENFDITGNTGAFSFDSTFTGVAPGSAGAIYGCKKYEFSRIRSRTEGAVIEARNADLTVYAAHQHAQVRLKQAITADRKLILSSNFASSGIGNVATRLAGDTINAVRESGATGAFNWNVRNSADSVTVSALSTANTEATAILDTAGTWDAS